MKNVCNKIFEFKANRKRTAKILTHIACKNQCDTNTRPKRSGIWLDNFFVDSVMAKCFHIGLRKKVKQFVAVNKINEVVLKIDIEVDGIQITKSSNSQLVPYKEVFIIGNFHGYEMRSIEINPIILQGSRIKIDIRAFICNAPARTFILDTFNRITLLPLISFHIRHVRKCIYILV